MRPNGFFKKNGATILTGLGVVGVIGTTYSAIKATPKALQAIDVAEHLKGEELTIIEKAKVAGPVYIPTALFGTSTIVCILGANILNKKQQASLISGCGVIGQTYKEYRKKVEDVLGEEEAKKVEEAIVKDKYPRF